MNNVCLAGQVAVLFRRLVHAVSTVSAVQQYHFYNRNRTTAEHISSQPTIECQDLPLGQALFSPNRSSTIPRVFAEQWDRLKGRGFWDSWRSSMVLVGEAQREQSFVFGPLAFLPWFRPTRLHSTHSDPFSDQTPLSHPTATSELQPSGPESDPPTPRWSKKPNDDTIKKLMLSPTLFDPIRTPRYPIVLCHGLYGFDVRGPSSFPRLQQHYWHNILNILRGKVGAEVIVTSVPSTGSIASRAETLHNFLQNKAIARGVNFIGHSMGGLDCRYLISHFNPTEYSPLSLTTVGTPHRGSPFMDWCQENIGLGKMEAGSTAEREVANKLKAMESAAEAEKEDNPRSSKSSILSFASLPSSFTTYLLSMLDSPAYANLTTKYLTEVFNPVTPDNPKVKYFSIAGRCEGVSVLHPLWLPKLVLDGYELKLREQPNSSSRGNPDWQWGNDCLVSIESAKWGEFLGVLDECDHWAMRGASVLDLNYDLSSVTASIPSLSMKLGGGNGKDGEWSLLDWGRFVRLWKSEEANQMVSNRGLSVEAGREGPSVDDAKEREREDALKTSTDNVSAMVDWIVDQVPLNSKEKEKMGAVEKEESRKRDIASKEGLERLYVALSKKLYDEGL